MAPSGGSPYTKWSWARQSCSAVCSLSLLIVGECTYSAACTVRPSSADIGTQFFRDYSKAKDQPPGLQGPSGAAEASVLCTCDFSASLPLAVYPRFPSNLQQSFCLHSSILSFLFSFLNVYEYFACVCDCDHLCAWCQWRPEVGAGSPSTAVPDSDLSLHVGVGNPFWDLWKRSQCSQLPSLPPSSCSIFFFKM